MTAQWRIRGLATPALAGLLAFGATAGRLLLAPAPLVARTTKPAAKHQAKRPGVFIARGRGGTVGVPRSFFGLSTEYPALPAYMVSQATFERVLSLLRVRDDGPLALRIGGDSADLTYWNPGSFPLPPNAYVLTDAWFQATASLVRNLGLRVVFDLNLRRSTPELSARLASGALSHMPAGSVAGFEVGNEPDLYRGGYTVDDYVRDFQSYAAAVSAVAPTVPLMGPAAADTNPVSTYAWLRGVAAGDHPLLGELTAHRYGLNPCVPRGFRRYPTIGKVLSDRVVADVVSSVASAVQIAHAANLGLRLDEMNSVTCGGLAGVSNSFATALWAPDAILRMLHTGLDGLNIHIRPDTINGPFVVTQAGLSVRPLLYGLILVARTLDGNGRLVPLRVQTRGVGAGKLDAWAVGIRRELRVLLINKTANPTRAVLRFSAKGDATVERLRAQGARATSGVTLAGQSLGPDGQWLGEKVTERLPLKAGAYEVVMPRFSAALVSIQLR